MSNFVNVDFEKDLTHNGKNVYRMIKTKTNKYYLVDLATNRIIANTKREILNIIYDFGIKNNLGKGDQL